jgi:hypothetical protein
MPLKRTEHLPTDGSRWVYEMKLNGYRVIAANTGEDVRLWLRNLLIRSDGEALFSRRSTSEDEARHVAAGPQTV